MLSIIPVFLPGGSMFLFLDLVSVLLYLQVGIVCDILYGYFDVHATEETCTVIQQKFEQFSAVKPLLY